MLQSAIYALNDIDIKASSGVHGRAGLRVAFGHYLFTSLGVRAKGGGLGRRILGSAGSAGRQRVSAARVWVNLISRPAHSRTIATC